MAQDKIGGVKAIVAATQGALAATARSLDSSPKTMSEQPERRDDEAVPLAPTPDLNPRNRAAAEIAARANATRTAEASETIPPGAEDLARQEFEPDPEIQNTAGDAEPQPLQGKPRDDAGKFVSAEPQAETPKAPAGFDAEAEYDLMVEGKPIKVKGSQIIDMGRRSIQKELASDYKLALASDLLKRAEQAQPSKDVAPLVPEQEFLDIAQAVQFGTTEQAAGKFKAVVDKAVTAAVQQVVKAVPAISQDQAAFMEGKRLVETEYADLMADPYLKPVFEAEEVKRRKAGYQGSYTELYKTIGEDLRKHFNRPKVGAAAKPAPSLEQRQEAKASAPSAPKLASVRLSGGGEEKKPATRAEIIEAMRESRGQNALTKH